MFSQSTGVFAAVLLSLSAFVFPASAPEVTPELPQTTVKGSPLLQCSVYQITNADLIKGIEAATQTNSNDPKATLELLKSANAGATRLARVHAPLTFGHDFNYRQTAQVPMLTINEGQFSKQTSFGGYKKATSHLSFRCQEAGQMISTQFSIQIESFKNSGRKSRATPPPTDKINLDGNAIANSGTTRMYQIDTGADSNRMTLVFVTVTNI